MNVAVEPNSVRVINAGHGKGTSVREIASSVNSQAALKGKYSWESELPKLLTFCDTVLQNSWSCG
jgi:hypothetical protein